MFVLENGDKLQGDASAATVVDYHISGITGGTTLKNLADGQLPATIGDLYTSASTDAATTITLVNTDSVARTVNLYHTPSGGTARRVIPKDLSLSAGYSVVIDGGDIRVIGTDGSLQTGTALGASEVKTLYESNSDTNAFTDADHSKLDGVEALADVTDATNVNAAGATMNTDADVSGNTWVVDEDDLTSDSATKVPTQQSVKAYVDTLTASAGSLTEDVTQTSHGLSVGNWIKSSGTANEYAKAQADSVANAEVIGVVTEVADANNFTYTHGGAVDVAGAVPVQTAGTVLFLDPDTAGAATATDPTTTGDVSKPIAVVLESNAKMLLFALRGMEVTDTVNPIAETIIDAKGDLILGSASDAAARLAIGTNDQVLTADSTQSTGVKWADASGGGGILVVPMLYGFTSGSGSNYAPIGYGSATEAGAGLWMLGTGYFIVGNTVLPSGFTSVDAAYIWITSSNTSEGEIRITVNFASAGEDFEAGGSVNTTTTSSWYTQGATYDLEKLDISSLMTGAAAGDTVQIMVERTGSEVVVVISAFIEYS